MKDIFDKKIFCERCNIQMERDDFFKQGFKLRALVCPKCNERIVHPVDVQEFKKFKELRGKEFSVKMRLVGNSYAVSIPKEIVSFMHEQEKMFDDMVRLCFEDFGRVSLNFNKMMER